MERPKGIHRCLRGYQFITTPVCAACDKIHKCRYFQRYYAKNKEKVITDITKYIEKHKNKYEMGVCFMAKNLTEKQFLVLDQGKITNQVTKKEAEDMVLKYPKKSKELIFLPVSQVLVPVITIRLVTKKLTDTQLNKIIKHV